MSVRTLIFSLLTAVGLAFAGNAGFPPATALAQSSAQDNPFARDYEREPEDNESDASAEEGANARDQGDDDGDEPVEGDDTEAADRAPAVRDPVREFDDDFIDERDRLSEPLEVEPYEPLGIRIGSFLVFPELEAERSHTDNVFTSASATRSDWSTAWQPSIEFQSDWSRHELTGLFEYEKVLFDEFTSEDEENLAANLRGRIDIGRRTNLEAEIAFVSETESRGDINVPNNVAVRPTETTKGGAVQLEHTFNRLTVRLRGEMAEEEFEDVSLAGGGTFNNASRDNTERELIGRMSYELKPGVAVFTEGRGNEIELARPLASGLRLDSNGWAALGGFSIDMDGIVTGEIAAGFAQQLPDNGALQGIEGAILAANIIWTLNPLTEIRFDAEFDVETTILTASIGSLVRTFGVEVEHAFRENLILTAGVEFEMEDFAAANLEEETLEFGIEGEYLLNRMVGFVAGYEFTNFTSTNSTNDYQENLFRMGVRLRR